MNFDTPDSIATSFGKIITIVFTILLVITGLTATVQIVIGYSETPLKAIGFGIVMLLFTGVATGILVVTWILLKKYEVKLRAASEKETPKKQS